MPWYELVYETGNHSVAYYEDDEEMLSAVSAHHARAVAGERGNSLGTSNETGAPIPGLPAERIKVVYQYKKHPGDTGDEDPRVDTPPHESNYAMKEQRAHLEEQWA